MVNRGFSGVDPAGFRWDAVVVGAGPAGLTAAMYLARFRRRTLVIHDGAARALRIPSTHNAPGFPDGVSGRDLIERMTGHARRYGAEFAVAQVAAARADDDGFALAGAAGEVWQCRSLILATGIYLNEIAMPRDQHEAAIDAGILRYCPVCDGFEHIDTRIGIIGCDSQGAAEALFMRNFSADVTLLPLASGDLEADEAAAMAKAGIVVEPRRIVRYEPTAETMRVHLEGGGDPLVFDVVYPALGCRPRNELALSLALPMDGSGNVGAEVAVGAAREGVFAIGDIVEGLDQISTAMGQGAVAATKAHNWLRGKDGQTLDVMVAG